MWLWLNRSYRSHSAKPQTYFQMLVYSGLADWKSLSLARLCLQLLPSYPAELIEAGCSCWWRGDISDEEPGHGALWIKHQRIKSINGLSLTIQDQSINHRQPSSALVNHQQSTLLGHGWKSLTNGQFPSNLQPLFDTEDPEPVGEGTRKANYVRKGSSSSTRCFHEYVLSTNGDTLRAAFSLISKGSPTTIPTPSSQNRQLATLALMRL